MSQPKDSGKKKTSKAEETTKKSSSMEGRVKDYLYNPDTKEKIEPPSEEEELKKEQASQQESSETPKKKSKKKQTKKKQAKTKLHPGAKIAIGAAKVAFLWVPLIIVSVVFVALIIAKAVLSPSRVEKLATENFNSLSNATLSLDVQYFSPYNGFVIENLRISQPEGFGKGNFVSIDRLVLDYGFFALFTGDVSFREIGIYAPKIHLVQKDGIWNAAKLMKEREKKPEEPKEEKPKKDKKEEDAEPKDSIKLPIAVNILFNFILRDLDVFVESDEFKASLTSFDTEINLDIPPAKEIPLGPKAVNLIRKFALKVNPDKKLNVSYDSEIAKVSPPLLLSLELLFSGEDEKDRRFHSSFIAGTAGAPIRFQEKNLKPLNFTAAYDISYDAIADDVKINSFAVQFAGDKWLDLGGSVTGVTKEPKIDIFMKQSAIVLDKLYPYYLAFMEDDSTKFGGTISLKPLSVKGSPTDIAAAGDLSITSLKASVPSFGIDMPKFNLNYDVKYRGGNVDADTSIAMPAFVYKLGRSSSGKNNLFLDLSAKTAAQFKQFDVSKFAFRFNDARSGQDALSIDMTARANTANSISANVDMTSLVFRKGPLINMVPREIGKSLESIPLEKPVSMTMNAQYRGEDTSQGGTVLIGIRVPDYDVYDLRIRTDAGMNTETKIASINEFRLWSSSYGVDLRSNGFIDTKPGQDVPFANSDIRVSLSFVQNELRKMYDTWELGGKVSLNARMRGDLKNGNVKGSIDIDDLDVRNENKNLLLLVEDINMSFPYEYDFKSSFTGKSRTASDKEDVIQNQYFTEKENFTIKSIKAIHPSRPIQYEYLNDLSASMEFRDNAFTINRFKSTVMNGSIYLRNTFFYVADFSMENMEYNLMFDAVNLDIGKLDNPDKETREADISLTTRISGKGLNVAENLTTEGTVEIYKIGNQIANELMKVMSEKEGESKLGATQFVVDNTMDVDRFIFYIDKGNVYATVKLEQKLISQLTFTQIENNEIKYERIPVQEFLSSIMGGEEQ